MISLALKDRFLEARDRLYRIFAERGAAAEDVLRAVHSYVTDPDVKELSDREKVRLIEYLGEVDFRLSQGASERVQMEAVLARLAALKDAGK